MAPVIALSFDDGPDEWTEPILDLLRERDARATFFVLGCKVDRGEETILRALQDGHEIGNHGWSHTRMSGLTAREVMDELAATGDALGAIGSPPRFWRAPHDDAPPHALHAARAIGYGRPVVADVDPYDWTRAPADVVADVLEGLLSATIVALHDGLPPDGGTGWPHRRNTVEAVQRLLAELPDARFVTVGELLAWRVSNAQDDGGLEPDASGLHRVDDMAMEQEYAEVLAALVRATKPSLVLEAGTGRGITSRMICEALVANGYGRLITFERDEAYARAAHARLVGLPVEIRPGTTLGYMEQMGTATDAAPDLVFLDSSFHSREDELLYWLDRHPPFLVVHDSNRPCPLPAGLRLGLGDGLWIGQP